MSNTHVKYIKMPCGHISIRPRFITVRRGRIDDLYHLYLIKGAIHFSVGYHYTTKKQPRCSSPRLFKFFLHIQFS